MTSRLAGLAIALFPAAAWSCVNLNFSLSGSSFNLLTNPTPTLTATVTANTTLSGCSFFLTVNYGAATSYSSRALKQGVSYTWPYQVYDGTFVLKTLADATSNNDVLEGSFSQAAGNQSSPKTFQVSLDQTNLYRRFGNYTESTVTVTLYRGTIASPTFVRTRNFSLSYNAPKKIDLSLVDPSSAFNLADSAQLMDFGTSMTTGSTASADLLVKYNAGYRIRLSSANNGVLKHTTASTNTIPYTFTFNGSPVVLAGTASSPTQVEFANGVSPTDGLRRPLQAVVGSTAGKPAGQYQDIITVTVVSNE